MRRIVTGDRLAIRVDSRTLLSVPPIPPGTTSERRVKILELVLRRQLTLAELLASGGLDAPPKKTFTDTVSDLITERPYAPKWAA